MPRAGDWVALVVKSPPVDPGDTRDRAQSLGREGAPEEGTATPSSILAWRIAQTEEPGGLQSMGSQRVGRSTGLGVGGWDCRCLIAQVCPTLL